MIATSPDQSRDREGAVLRDRIMGLRGLGSQLA